MKHFGLILQHFFRWISFQKESLSLLFGYHGCLRLETPRLYKLKPTALKREKSRSAHALLQWLKKPWFEIFWQTPSSGFLRINSGIGFWKHHPGRKSRSGAWKHHFHLKWSKCITTETRFVMQFARLFPYTFFPHWRASTLVTVTNTNWRINTWEGLLYIQWWHSTSTQKKQLTGKAINKIPLASGCIVSSLCLCSWCTWDFCFSCSTRKNLGERLLHNAKLSCWLGGWPLTSAKSLALKSSCGSGLGGWKTHGGDPWSHWSHSEFFWALKPWCESKIWTLLLNPTDFFGVKNLIHLQTSSKCNQASQKGGSSFTILNNEVAWKIHQENKKHLSNMFCVVVIVDHSATSGTNKRPGVPIAPKEIASFAWTLSPAQRDVDESIPLSGPNLPAHLGQLVTCSKFKDETNVFWSSPPFTTKTQRAQRHVTTSLLNRRCLCKKTILNQWLCIAGGHLQLWDSQSPLVVADPTKKLRNHPCTCGVSWNVHERCEPLRVWDTDMMLIVHPCHDLRALFGILLWVGHNDMFWCSGGAAGRCWCLQGLDIGGSQHASGLGICSPLWTLCNLDES